jgi:hypothetical protein
MPNRDFFRFLDRSLDYASLDLVGMSLIILKKPYAGTRIKLRENRTNVIGDTYGIDGTIWMEPKSESSLNVHIKERDSKGFKIGSDIAKSFYKYYYKDDEEFPSLIHV